MQSSEMNLYDELKSRGFEIEGLREQKTMTDHAKQILAERGSRGAESMSKPSFDQVIQGKNGKGKNLNWLFYPLLVLSAITSYLSWTSVTTGAPESDPVVYLPVMTSVFLAITLMAGYAAYKDIWAQAVWRYLVEQFSNPKPITDQEVIEQLSTKLQEKQEKVLGVKIADEKQKLENTKEDLQEYRRTLQAQRKGNEDHGLEGEIDAFLEVIDAKINKIDDAVEDIDEFLQEVRQLAEDIAAKILPVYRRRQKIQELFEEVPVKLEEADQCLRSAEEKLEESHLNLKDRLDALQSVITRANLVSAELSKLTAEDAIEKDIDGVIGSVEKLATQEPAKETVGASQPS